MKFQPQHPQEPGPPQPYTTEVAKTAQLPSGRPETVEHRVESSWLSKKNCTQRIKQARKSSCIAQQGREASTQSELNSTETKGSGLFKSWAGGAGGLSGSANRL